jgi:hypothetical protein
MTTPQQEPLASRDEPREVFVFSKDADAATLGYRDFRPHPYDPKLDEQAVAETQVQPSPKAAAALSDALEEAASQDNETPQQEAPSVPTPPQAPRVPVAPDAAASDQTSSVPIETS